jgi:hypothetical protein
MIDVIAMILSIIGTPLIASTVEKRRMAGFLIWITGNACWIAYGFWIIQSWPVVIMFSWYQVWCVVGALGCYGAMKKVADPIQ